MVEVLVALLGCLAFAPICLSQQCNDLLKSYRTDQYICHSSDEGEINTACRFDLSEEVESVAKSVLSNLTSHGYRLCFGCGTDNVLLHCPRVAICTKSSQCYSRVSSHGKHHFGCCDKHCGACTGSCTGDFCNGDTDQKIYIDKLIRTTTPVPTTTPTTTPTTPTTTPTTTTTPTPTTITTTPIPKLATVPLGWGDWGSWSQCYPTSCSGDGFEVRTRVCLQGNGLCPGLDNVKKLCKGQPCPGYSTMGPSTSTAAPTTTPTMMTTTMMPKQCVDEDDTITGTCAYWKHFRICEPGTDGYDVIGKIHCRKTCNLC